MKRWMLVLAIATASACFSKPGAPGPGDGGGSAFDPGLLDNGGFELGCTSWLEFDSDVSPATVAHTGTGSCRVCVEGRDYYYVRQDLYQTFTPGERYAATAWIRATDDKPADGVGINLTLRNDVGVTVDEEIGAQISPSTEWQQVSNSLTVSDGSGVDLIIAPGARFASDPSCFLIDDAALHQLP